MINKSNRSYKMTQSPFYVSELREAKTDKKISVKLPTKAYNQIMKYSNESQGIDNESKIFRELCFGRLDNLCLDWKTFNNLECYMLIPKFEKMDNDNKIKVNNVVMNKLDVLNEYSEIISIVNTESDYIEGFEPSSRFNIKKNDCTFHYDLEHFNKSLFPSDKLFNTKTSCVKYIPNEKLYDFNILTNELNKRYYDLNIDDCYFVHFPLNNYLDIKRDGQFQHESSEHSQHKGLYVFDNVLDDLTLYCVLDWKYSFDTGAIYFSFNFTDQSEFIKIINDYEGKGNHKQKLENSIKTVVEENFHNLDQLLIIKDNLEKDLKFINDLIENYSSSDD